MAWPSTQTDGTEITSSLWNGIVAAFSTWGGNVDTAGYSLILNSSAPTDGNIPTRGIVIWIDEASHKLKFRVRYSDGTTLKSGEISLT
jgi:hypothetical protein